MVLVRLWVGPFPSFPCAGIQRFCRDIHMMLGFKPGFYFRACWLFLSPAMLLVTRVEGRAAGWRLRGESRALLGIQSGRTALTLSGPLSGLGDRVSTRIPVYSPLPWCPQLL